MCLATLLDFLDESHVTVLPQHRPVLPNYFLVGELEEAHLPAVEDAGRQVSEAIQNHGLALAFAHGRPFKLQQDSTQ